MVCELEKVWTLDALEGLGSSDDFGGDEGSTFELLGAVYPGGSRGRGAFGLRFGGFSSWTTQ